MTVSDLIKSSLRLIGAIATGESPTAAESADALVVLNDMLENWSIDGLMVYSAVREEFALSSGNASRTMGTSGNFDTTRPTKIIAASIMVSDVEYPLELITAEEFASISAKDVTASIPTKAYVQGTFPLETIYFWPVPSASSYFVPTSLKPITAFAAIATTISLPPGYTKALRYNLALELAPEYGRDPSAIVAVTAQDSKADIKRQNTRPVYMQSDVAGLTGKSSFNILTGE